MPANYRHMSPKSVLMSLEILVLILHGDMCPKNVTNLLLTCLQCCCVCTHSVDCTVGCRNCFRILGTGPTAHCFGRNLICLKIGGKWLLRLGL